MRSMRLYVVKSIGSNALTCSWKSGMVTLGQIGPCPAAARATLPYLEVIMALEYVGQTVS